jgi:hypothetical protein
MSFDLNEVIKDMIDAVKATVQAKWKNVKDPATSYIESRKDRLEFLASARLNNEIDEDFFQKRLKDEKKILESELLSLKIVSTAIAQKAANAALEVLSKAIRTALNIV